MFSGAWLGANWLAVTAAVVAVPAWPVEALPTTAPMFSGASAGTVWA